MKRITAIFIIISMMFSFAAAESTVSENYDGAVSLLKYLNAGDVKIYENDELTRGQFVGIIGEILKYSTTANDERIFFDVSEMDENSAYITALAKIGALSGYSDGNFGVDDIITKPQAVKILLNLLGYRLVAETKGGFPSGYTILANQLRLTSGIQLNSENLSGSEAALLIYNALTIPIYDIVTMGKSISYDSSKENTLLKQLYNISKYRGRIAKLGKMTYYPFMPELSDGYAEIDNRLYRINSAAADSADENFGIEIDYFACEDDVDYPEIVYLYPVYEVNKKIISSKDISYVTEANGQISINYLNDNDRSLKATLSAGAALIVNNRAGSLEIDEFLKLNTTITLIDTNQNNGYDLVRIERYNNLVVEAVDTSEGTIYGKYSNYSYEELDLNSPEYETEIHKNGNLVGLRNINKWDVLSIYVGGTGQNLIKKAVINTEAVKGAVESISDDEVIVNGETYIISESYFEASKTDGAIARIPNPGDGVVLYLDVKGEIAAIDYNTNKRGDILYGYLIKAGIKKDIDKTVTLRIIDQNSVFETYTLSENVKCNEIKESPESIYNSKLTASEGNVVRQLIKFKTDLESNEITSIYIAAEPETVEQALEYYDNGIFTLNARGVSTSGSVVRRYYSNKAGKDMLFVPGTGEVENAVPQIILDKKPIVFVVPPATGDDEMQNNEKYYSVAGVDTLERWTWSVVAAYDMDKFSRPAAMIKYYSSNEPSGVCMVDKIFERYDEESGEIQTCIQVVTSSGSVVYKGKNKDVFTKVVDGVTMPLKRGDNITITCDMDDRAMRSAVSVTLITGSNYDRGEVISIDNDIIRILPINSADSQIFYMRIAQAPYYNTDTGTIELRKTIGLKQGTIISYKVYYGSISAYTIVSEP